MLVPLLLNLDVVLPQPPTILANPMPQSVALNGVASFAVVATGPSLTYQWRKNGSLIPGATSSFYNTPPTVAGDSGALFSVIVTNSAGSVTSTGALLTVISPTTVLVPIGTSPPTGRAALADVDICNMALSHLSISTGIQSLNPPDNSAAAQACAFWYAKCRDELLQSAPWNFAYTYIALVSDGSALPGTSLAFPGWQYAYQYPSDCLQPIAVTTQAGLRLGPAFWSNWWWPYPSQNYAIPKIPFKLIQSNANPGQLAIACDLSAPAYLFYIQSVTNTALFDPMFAETLSFLVGWRIGGPLRANIQKIQALAQIYAQKRLEALAQHLNASQQDLERDSPSIQARW